MQNSAFFYFVAFFAASIAHLYCSSYCSNDFLASQLKSFATAFLIMFIHLVLSALNTPCMERNPSKIRGPVTLSWMRNPSPPFSSKQIVSANPPTFVANGNVPTASALYWLYPHGSNF